LVDAGLSRRETVARLAAIGETIDDLDGILVSHEHTDHVSGIWTVAKRRDKRPHVPVYVTEPTYSTLAKPTYEPAVETFCAGTKLVIGDIEVETYTTPHDAIDPIGFCFYTQGLKAGLVTDLGYMPDSIRFHLRDTDFLILESNHDVEMLKVGPYPWQVKQRVMGRKGHLSNDVASDFIRLDLAATTRTLVLGHLSEQNNHPELARLAAAQALAGRGLPTSLVVALPKKQTEVFHL
jgi:phosphoribosyl 1,2-cyclic phosphodiesterase